MAICKFPAEERRAARIEKEREREREVGLVFEVLDSRKFSERCSIGYRIGWPIAICHDSLAVDRINQRRRPARGHPPPEFLARK